MAERRGLVFLSLVMAAWIAAGFAGAAVAAVLMVASWVLLTAGLGFRAVPAPDQIAYVLIAACGFQGTLLLGAFWQGRRAGDGDWRTGLGIRAIERGTVVALLCVAMIGWLFCFLGLVAAFPALRDFVKSAMPELMAGQDDRGLAVVALQAGLVAILAPVSEELFFRGWLWEAVRQQGHTVAMTAALTAVPWLLLHGIDSPARMVFLIPAALMFSLARHVGRGTLASLAVHVTNNTAAVAMQVVSKLAGHE
jgi:membrane protease YdiL (CAAX protease family)